jgi:hypothetical protein
MGILQPAEERKQRLEEQKVALDYIKRAARRRRPVLSGRRRKLRQGSWSSS